MTNCVAYVLLYFWARFNGEMRSGGITKVGTRSTEFVYVAWQTQHLLDLLAVEDALDLGQLCPRQVLVQDLLQALEFLSGRHVDLPLPAANDRCDPEQLLISCDRGECS